MNFKKIVTGKRLSWKSVYPAVYLVTLISLVLSLAVPAAASIYPDKKAGGSGGYSVITPSSLTTTEAGGTDSFTITLDTKPLAPVTIGLSSSDMTEGAVSPSALTFTADVTNSQTRRPTADGFFLGTWNPAQYRYWYVNPEKNFENLDSEYITGQGTSDGNAYALFTFPAFSIPSEASSINLAVNFRARSSGLLGNNVHAGIQVNGVRYYGSSHNPDTGWSNYSYSWASNPSGSGAWTPDQINGVSSAVELQQFGVYSSDLSPDIDVSEVKAVVTYIIPSNWNVPQTVTVTGVNDLVDDGNIAYSIITAPAVSTDFRFNGLNLSDVSVTNTDNDTAGITVTPTSGLLTTEAGGQATFSVVLNTEPTASVTIPLSSGDTTEGTIPVSSLVFTTAGTTNTPAFTNYTYNRNPEDTLPKRVDFAKPGGVALGDFLLATIVLSKFDNSLVSITPPAGWHLLRRTDVIQTAYDCYMFSYYKIADNSDLAASYYSWTWTANIGNTYAIGGITHYSGVDPNNPVDLSAAAQGSVSFPSGANTATAPSVNTNWPNDRVITFFASSTNLAASGFSTPEGMTERFEYGMTVDNLHYYPSLAVDDMVQAAPGSTGARTTTMTPYSANSFTDWGAQTIALRPICPNWATPQTVTVSGVNDDVDDGDIVFPVVTGIAASADTTYNGINPANAQVTNIDDDTASFIITPTSGLTTSEAGGQATFTVKLNSQPTGDVTITLTSSNSSEGNVDKNSLTFTSFNWFTAQTVTVTGADDLFDDGNVNYSIVTAVPAAGDPLYRSINPPDVSVTNTDDDTASFTVTPTSGLTTTEAGGQAAFTLKLNTRPTADVTIGISSSNTGEGMVDKSSLTFTSLNWSSAQTVTVTGVDDYVDDGNVAYSIITAAASTSADTVYKTINPSDVSVTNTDNDTAGFTLIPASGLSTTEAGTTATFTIKLNTRPTADVTIGISSSNTGEGMVDKSSLTFTSLNWSSAQTVTVTGVDDNVDDGNVAYSIITAAASASADTVYKTINPSDVSAANTDNDTAGITVTPVSGLTTTEAGATATFAIKLNTQPTANVTIGISSSDTTEGTVSPASLTFTSVNWSQYQNVTVTGKDDAVNDGNIPYTILTAAAVSGDSNYSGKNPSDVSVTNTDNDTAGFTVIPTSGLVTTEAGGTAAFSIKLTSQPTANVTIGISSSNPLEGTVNKTSLTFTSTNWSTAQTVTITGADDAYDDGNQSYSIITAAASASLDLVYKNIDPLDVSVTNTDNDTAGITVNPTSGLNTTEAGGAAVFTIKLNSRPSGDVTIGISSNDPTEGTASPASLNFNSTNWSTPQTVTVTGIDDAPVDGNVGYTIITSNASSGDNSYNNMVVADVAVTNSDNDTAGITVNPTSGLVTSEAGGVATFTVVLNTEPAYTVYIGLSSDFPEEGTVESPLNFNTSNWATPQTVIVTGVDDAAADGNREYNIAFSVASPDGVYESMLVPEVTVTNLDNDTAGITVTPASGLTTAEAETTATFTVKLNTQPAYDVTIGVSSGDATEGTVFPASLTFTSINWNTVQTVTVTGADDFVNDGDIAYTVMVDPSSSDSDYNSVDTVNVAVTNEDDDIAGITISPTTGLTTTEAGGTEAFTVRLDSEPTASVAITISSGDSSEGSVDKSSLTFTTTDWSTLQTVTVTGVDDSAVDGNILYSIITDSSSADPVYDSLDPPDVSVTNTDNDTAGINVSPTSGLTTTEAGGSAEFTVVLATRPSADVTIGISSGDITEGTVFPDSLIFTSANWSDPQTVTVTGADDAEIDGNVDYTIVTAAAFSGDNNYNSQNADDVLAVNNDNDTAAITVNPTGGLTTTEAGDSSSFTLVLDIQPSEDVTIGLTSSDITEGFVSPDSLTFTSLDWNVPQTVTVSGLDDDEVDGNIPYFIVTAPAVSTDSHYSGLNADNISVTNHDNDAAGIAVNPVSDIATSEAGGAATFTVVLNSQPSADVTIGISSNDLTEGTVSPDSLSFTSTTWNITQTVTVSGVDDLEADENMPYSIITAPAVSTDGYYNGLNADNVSLTNLDNDLPGITVNPTGGLTTTEAGGEAAFTVVLNTQPTGDVTIGISSGDSTEGSVDTSSLIFTSANWSDPQTVTITGVDDAEVDGNVSYSIITAGAVSSDSSYTGMNADDVEASNADDDTAGITVNPTSGLTTTEAGGTAAFTILLNTQPGDNVTIGISSSNTAEGTVFPDSLTFTQADWSDSQTVTVTGVDDALIDGNIAYSVITAAVVSADGNYNNMNPSDVSVTNADNETAGITVNPTSGLVTTESGGDASFSVVLNTQPAADVIIDVSSSNSTEGTVSPDSMTFTPVNWSAPQTVTITGIDDAVVDGNEPYMVDIPAAISGDSTYNGMDPVDVNVTNTDNDTTGAADRIGVETEADGSGIIVPAQSLIPGSPITVYAVSRDAAHNFVANVSADFWSIIVTGGVRSSDLVVSQDSKSAVFTGHRSGTAVFRVASGALTAADSGLVTVTAGPAAGISVETAADGSGTVVPARTLISGSSITVYAISRDAFGNFIANIAADDWSLPTMTGGTAIGDLIPNENKKSAVFTAHFTGTAVIRATAGALAAVDSGLITVLEAVDTATGTGQAAFGASSGIITGLLSTDITPGGPDMHNNTDFPHGFFSFEVSSITPGSTVIITIVLPWEMPVGVKYFIAVNGAWIDAASLTGDDDGDNILTLTITDGGLGDGDSDDNGTIVVQGGPGYSMASVGGEVAGVNKQGLLAPWLVLLLVPAVWVAFAIFRRKIR
jgi:large repetitive protein